MKRVRVSSFSAINMTTTILCTILALASTFCLVLCFENENQQRLSSLNLKENSDRPLWPPINDRVALKELYEMYNDVDPIWKRAPAAGFYGVRGKKVPGHSFFGMRGKKGPSGFLGMRGKKMEGKLYGLDDSSAAAVGGIGLESEADSLDSFLGDLLNSKESHTGKTAQQRLVLGDNLSDDHTEIKRAPADGFMGLRGKRNLSTKDKPFSHIH